MVAFLPISFLSALLGLASSPGATNASLASKAHGQALGRVESFGALVASRVRSDHNQRIGKVEDMLADLDSGGLLYVVVSAGGVLGVGERLLAIPPSVFRLEDERVIVAADRSKLAEAPQYLPAKDEQGQMESPSYVRGVYRCFGKISWWQGASSSSSSGQFGNVHRLGALKGMSIQSPGGRRLGTVNDVLVDLPHGRVVFVVLSPDRSLNLDGNLFALPPNEFATTAGKRSLLANISRERLAAAPHFAGNHRPDFSDPVLAARIYRYYGKRAYFRDPSQLQPTSNPRP